MRPGMRTRPSCAALIAAFAFVRPCTAQDIEANGPKHHHYQLIDLGTLGGTRSYFSPGSGNDIGQYSHVLNDRGIAAGLANTSLSDPFPNFCFDLENDCLLTHAFRTQSGRDLKDLGALPGGGSSAALWISKNGLIAGVSQNGEIDPLFTNPAFPPFPENRAVLWKDGEIIDLGRLPEGGYESYAAAVNDREQVVGAAINTVPDPNSMASSTFWLGLPFGYQVRAFLWEKDSGMQDLGTLPGGTDAQAILINQAGQVVGYSYTGSEPTSFCAFPLATGSFIWEKGKGMKDLGGLGGTCTAAFDLNEHGQIVGASNLAGDQSQHAFLWEKDSIHDLGGSLGGDFTGAFAENAEGNAVGFAYLPGDSVFHAVLWKQIGHLTDLGVIGTDQCSNADSINDAMQVVGNSSSTCYLDASNVRAFLWENGSLIDLNDLVPPGSSLNLQFTETINSRGEIAGTGADAKGNHHAFLLIPCDENHPNIEGCDYNLTEGTISAKGQSLTNSVPAPNAASEIQKSMEQSSSSWRRGFRNPSATAAVPLTSAPVLMNSTITTASPNTGAPLAITSGQPPSGRVGHVYDVHVRCSVLPATCLSFGFTVTAAGGLPPYSWSWTPQAGSSLPPGLSFPGIWFCSAVARPAICGKPTTAGIYEVVITVKDSESPPRQASASYAISVFP